MLSHNLNRFITGLVVIYVSSITIVFAQTAGNEKEKAPVSFGKISVVDFKRSAYPIDSLATAVIIADIGSSRIEGNNKGWFSVIHTHYRRVHILNKTAYDLADVIINLYKDSGDQEKLVKVKANTYNLEGDKIITNALANRDIFTDKGDKNHLTKKFTLPNVKEGAIIEYEYTTSSDFYSIFNLGRFRALYHVYGLSIR